MCFRVSGQCEVVVHAGMEKMTLLGMESDGYE